jgi:hypothetical protein
MRKRSWCEIFLLYWPKGHVTRYVNAEVNLHFTVLVITSDMNLFANITIICILLVSKRAVILAFSHAVTHVTESSHT